MKPLTPLTLVLLCTLAGTAGAQVQATAPVKANVQQDLQLTSEGTTDFGTIGNFAHIEKIDPAAPTANQTVAQFTTSSTDGRSVMFSCPTAVTLTGLNDAVMTFTPQVNTAGFAEGQALSTPVVCSPGFLSDQFPAYAWLGGSIDVAAGQLPGSYSGVFTLTATYQ
jgi:hypothetical protein